MSKEMVPPRLPFKTKLGYGAAELSSTLTWTMVSVLFLFYLTDIEGLDPAFAGFVLMLGAMWDAVSDPTVGVMSDRFTSRWGRRRPFLLAVAVPFGVCTVFPILITWRATRGGELHPEGVTIRLRDILDGPLKNRTFLYTMGLYASASVGLSSAAATMVYFMKYYMNFSETQESLAFLFLFACTILWIPVINRLSSKYGKREAYILFIGLWVVIQAVGMMVLTPSMIIPFYAMMVLASGGVMSISMTIWAMIPDAVEVDELKCGQRREGLFFGVISFVRKLAVAFFIWMIGIILSKIGYIAGQAQTDGVLWGIRLLYAEGVAFFLLLSVVGAYFLPMTRKRHAALKRAIQQKKAGEEWDETSLKAIL